MDLDVVKRLTQLRTALPSLRLYALVDGIQYENQRGERLEDRPGFVSLFRGTPDGPLAHAGPWLVDVEDVGDTLASDLASLEREALAVSWLISEADLVGLAQLLQLHLDVRLPDGSVALLRFWDPRVLASLANVLDPQQRSTLFAYIQEWHLLHDGQRAFIGRKHVEA